MQDRTGVATADEMHIIVIDEDGGITGRSEEHTSELQSRTNLVCRLLLEKKKLKLIYFPITNHSESILLG